MFSPSQMESWEKWLKERSRMATAITLEEAFEAILKYLDMDRADSLRALQTLSNRVAALEEEKGALHQEESAASSPQDTESVTTDSPSAAEEGSTQAEILASLLRHLRGIESGHAGLCSESLTLELVLRCSSCGETHVLDADPATLTSQSPALPPSEERTIYPASELRGSTRPSTRDEG